MKQRRRRHYIESENDVSTQKGRLRRDALPPLRRAWEGAARLAKLCCPWCCDRRRCALGSDGDPARLLRFGDFTCEIDVKQAVFKARAGHMDVIRELEAPLERAGGYPLIEHFLFRLFALALAFPRSTDCKSIFLGFDREIRCAEACDRHRYPVGVLTGAFAIIGRLTL